MKSRLYVSLTICTFVAGAALAHHLATPLSSQYGAEILTKITLFAKADNKGVPSYHVGSDEHGFAIAPGASFSVSANGGAAQSVVFDTASFADPAEATPEEVAAAVNAQIDNAEMIVDNETLVLRGLHGGAAADLLLQDGAGGALAALGFAAASIAGSDDIHLVLSIPPKEDHPENSGGGGADLAHHPYFLIASTTAGSTNVGGHVIPLALDAFTHAVVRGTQFGLLPGFAGELDDNSDAAATFDTALLPLAFPGGLPDRVYFAYVVLNHELSDIEFVSNAFEVEIVD